jgi:hypothetical protein
VLTTKRVVVVAALWVAVPCRADGLGVVAVGPIVGSGGPDVGGELSLDLGHDFRRVRVAGRFRFTGSAVLDNEPAGFPTPAYFTLAWGPELEVRVGASPLRFGLAPMFGVGIVRYADDSPTMIITAVGAIWEPLLWAAVDLWRDARGRGVVLLGEGSVDLYIDTTNHRLQLERGAFSLLIGYRF